MALVSINGQDGIETKVCTPRAGAWHVDALVDDPDGLAGRVTVAINDGALALNGTIVRSGLFADTSHLRIVAGAAGLGMSARPRPYRSTSVRTVLGDLLADAGETLSATADAAILATGLDAWTSTATPVGTLISLLLAAAAPGASWRMLADGTLWVGRETWPDAGVDSTLYQIFEDSAETGTMLIGVDAPLALVGTTFEGRRVSYTEATVGQQGQGVEMRLWFEDAAINDVDRLKKAFVGLAQRAAARIDRVDYGRMYPARVVQQTGATVDVEPDQVGGQNLIPDMAQVPLWLPPGMSVDGVALGRVMIGWFGGDPSRPFATAFDGNNVVKTAVWSVLEHLFLGDQPGAEPTAMMTAFLAALNAYLEPLATAAGLGAAMNPSGGAAAASALGTATTAWNQPALQATFSTTKVNVT